MQNIMNSNDGWIRFLPECYQEEQNGADFLQRFLGICQTVYEEETAKTWRLKEQLDPERADPEYLAELGMWLGDAEAALWEAKRYRKFLKRAVFLYQIRGTLKSLYEVTVLFTGSEVWLREMPGNVEILVPGDAVRTLHMKQRLTRVIRNMAGGTATELIVLEDRVRLNLHTYIGINSQLGGYGALVLREQNRLPLYLSERRSHIR